MLWSVTLLQHRLTILFVCPLSSWATTAGRILGPKDTATGYRIGSIKSSFRNLSITIPALYLQGRIGQVK